MTYEELKKNQADVLKLLKNAIFIDIYVLI